MASTAATGSGWYRCGNRGRTTGPCSAGEQWTKRSRSTVRPRVDLVETLPL